MPPEVRELSEGLLEEAREVAELALDSLRDYLVQSDRPDEAEASELVTRAVSGATAARVRVEVADVSGGDLSHVKLHFEPLDELGRDLVDAMAALDGRGATA